MSGYYFEFNSSIIHHKVRFNTDINATYEYLKAHKKTTQKCWINKAPVVDEGCNLYNPKVLIIINLN